MPAASATTFVYVSNAGSQSISVLALAPGGALTPVETVAVPGPAQAGSTMPMSVSRDKKRLYVALRNEPYSAVTFIIDAKSGKLTPVGSGRLADSMAYIFAERGGKFLLGASYGGNKVAVAPIGVDGTVRAARQAVATKNAHCILADRRTPTSCIRVSAKTSSTSTSSTPRAASSRPTTRRQSASRPRPARAT